jgi:hypothetical protein
LGNNGNVSLSELDEYVQDDVFKYGAKLEDMNKKLRQALEEQVRRRAIERESVESDLIESFGGTRLSQRTKTTMKLPRTTCCCE